MKANLLFFSSVAVSIAPCFSFVQSPFRSQPTWSGFDSIKTTTTTTTTTTSLFTQQHENKRNMHDEAFSTRRSWMLQQSLAVASLLATVAYYPLDANAADDDDTTIMPTLAAPPKVTDKIFLEIKGMGGPEGGSVTRRIVIGLFGNEAPTSVQKLKQLMTTEGLASPCKPKEEGRMLQREQLEANKVYNNCIEGQDRGVNYDYATIWRIIKGERIDVGAVAGRFVSRETPTWEETKDNSLKHDRPGIISVRRGSESGFGFTIFPGTSGTANTADLNANHIVVGEVLEGLDVIEALDNVPVITSAKVNYMGLTGGPTTKSAPSRSCRYGGPMYCNEQKPLLKLTIYKTGIL
jgi:cyclophilin family peptidyl-prolyl cis-trans isomerase